MNSLPLSIARRLAALTFFALALASQQPVRAQGLHPSFTAPAAELRVIVTPLSSSSVLRVRYESARYGSVRLQVRDAQGRVLYTDLIRRARFAGDFDLAAYPAGTYTLELQTPGTRYSRAVDLRKSSPAMATLVVQSVTQAAAAPIL